MADQSRACPRTSYFAYGLHICSDLELWPWGASDAVSRSECDVAVELAAVDEAFEAVGFGPGLEDAVLDWPGVGTFRIVGGERIVVRPAMGAATEELALIAAGAALALLLEQRGHAVLHGSCVDIDGEAIALLGPSGVGKSTTAATLRERGHALLSDGMTVVDLSGVEPLALPGPPHLKLWPDAIQSLSAPDAASHPVARQDGKRWYEARGKLAVDPMPLRRVYLLAPGTDRLRQRLSPAAGLLGLVKNYFLADFADARGRTFILQRCASLAEAVPVYGLQRGEALVELSSVIAELCRPA